MAGGYRSRALILVFGTICLDRVRRVPTLPAPGGYVEVADESALLGGEAANTANALRSWGAEVELFGNDLGDGVDGETIRRLLSDRGLSASPAGRSEAHATPVCDIYVTPDGERTMFGRGFATMEPTFDPARLPLRAGEWFTAEPNMANVSREAARAAQAAGMRTYLMDFIRHDDPVEPGSFWQSSTDWAGHRNNMQRNVEWVKRFVAERGCFAIVSDGPNGFVAGSPERPVRAYPPFPAPLVVDTTGAGDLFRAGMLFGLSQGLPMTDCLRFASAAGCLKCRALGATTDVPTVEEIRRHIAENPDVSRQYE